MNIQLCNSINYKRVIKSFNADENEKERRFVRYQTFLYNLNIENSYGYSISVENFNYVFIKAMRILNSKHHLKVATATKECQYQLNKKSSSRSFGINASNTLLIILYALSEMDPSKIKFENIISTFAYFLPTTLSQYNSDIDTARIIFLFNQSKIKNGGLITAVMFMLTLFNTGVEGKSTKIFSRYRYFGDEIVDLLNEYAEFFEKINDGYVIEASTSYKINNLLNLFCRNIDMVNEEKFLSDDKSIKIKINSVTKELIL